MRIAILPNWCKYLSLVLFIASFVVGFEDACRGFEEGMRSAQNTHNHENSLTALESIESVANQESVTLVSYVSDLLIMLAIITYILSKDKKDDEYINILRGKSLMIALLISILCCFIAYAFNAHIQGLWLLIIQFVSYLIAFKINKIATDPDLKVEDIESE